MRAVVSALGALGLSTTVLAQAPAQFAENAKRAATELQQATADIQKDARGQYRKLVYTIADASWDVKKTDSVLNPVQAVVKLKIVSSASDAFVSREDAERASAPFVSSTSVELSYAPAASGWAFLEGRLYADALRSWIPVEHTKCATRQIYICSVVDAFGVKR